MTQTWEELLTEVNRELDAEIMRNAMCNIYPNDDAANKRLYRKRDWHKNKGKRRIKEGYKGDRYV